MITNKQLKEMKSISTNDIDRNTIENFDCVNIDTNLPIVERYQNYLTQVTNPYFFRLNDTLVKVEFSDNDLSLQQALADTFIRKKNR